MVVKVLQINLDRTKRVVAEVREHAVRGGIDILAVQEPHVVEGKVAGFGVSVTKIYGGGRTRRVLGPQ